MAPSNEMKMIRDTRASFDCELKKKSKRDVINWSRNLQRTTSEIETVLKYIKNDVLLDQYKKPELDLFHLLLLMIVGKKKQAWEKICSYPQDLKYYRDAVGAARVLLFSTLTVFTTQQARHEAERMFFDPGHITGDKRMEDLFRALIRQRYRHKDEESAEVDLTGIPSRMFITAERLYQEKVVLELSKNKKKPKLGIPEFSDNAHLRDQNQPPTCFYGPEETFRKDTKVAGPENQHETTANVTLANFGHRTEKGCTVDDAREARERDPEEYVGLAKQYVRPERLGAIYDPEMGSYDVMFKAIMKPLIKCSDRNKEKEREQDLAQLMMKYARTGLRLSLEDLRRVKYDATEKECKAFNKFCFHVMDLEPSQWHSALYCNVTDWHIGMSVSQARCLIMISEGKMKWEDAFMNNSDFRVYSTKTMRDDLTGIRDRCEKIDAMYKEQQEDSAFTLSPEQGLRDLRKVYGD